MISRTATPAPPARPVRQIKVNRLFYCRTIRDKHHSHFDQHIEEPVPWIQMRGKWLAKAGFGIDTPVRIQVSEGRLVLTTERDSGNQ